MKRESGLVVKLKSQQKIDKRRSRSRKNSNCKVQQIKKTKIERLKERFRNKNTSKFKEKKFFRRGYSLNRKSQKSSNSIKGFQKAQNSQKSHLTPQSNLAVHSSQAQLRTPIFTSELLESNSPHSLIKTSYLLTKSNNVSLTDNIPKFSQTQKYEKNFSEKIEGQSMSQISRPAHHKSECNAKTRETQRNTVFRNKMRNEEYDYFKINSGNKEEDSFSKYCESILNKVSTQNEKFPSENGSFSETKESFLQCRSVQNNSSQQEKGLGRGFDFARESGKMRINVDMWVPGEKFMSNRKQKRRNQSEKVIPENHRTKTQESASETPTQDQNKRFSDCFVKYSSISKDNKKLSIQNSFVIENRKTTESNPISDKESELSMISLDSDIDEKTKSIVEKMIQNDQNRQEIEHSRQDDIFKRKTNSPEVIEETGESFVNGRQLLEDLIKENANPRSSKNFSKSSSTQLKSFTSVEGESSEAVISLNSLIQVEGVEQQSIQERVKNISLIEFNENFSLEPSESSNKLPQNCMNSLDMMESEHHPETIHKNGAQLTNEILSFADCDDKSKISQLKFLENMYRMDYFPMQPKENTFEVGKMFDTKHIRIQERLMRFNEPQLHEIKEESTILEKSNSTSKIMSSKFQSRILTNSLINNSQQYSEKNKWLHDKAKSKLGSNQINDMQINLSILKDENNPPKINSSKNFIKTEKLVTPKTTSNFKMFNSYKSQKVDPPSKEKAKIPNSQSLQQLSGTNFGSLNKSESESKFLKKSLHERCDSGKNTVQNEFENNFESKLKKTKSQLLCDIISEHWSDSSKEKNSEIKDGFSDDSLNRNNEESGEKKVQNDFAVKTDLIIPQKTLDKSEDLTASQVKNTLNLQKEVNTETLESNQNAEIRKNAESAEPMEISNDSMDEKQKLEAERAWNEDSFFCRSRHYDMEREVINQYRKRFQFKEKLLSKIDISPTECESLAQKRKTKKMNAEYSEHIKKSNKKSSKNVFRQHISTSKTPKDETKLKLNDSPNLIEFKRFQSFSRSISPQAKNKKNVRVQSKDKINAFSNPEIDQIHTPEIIIENKTEDQEKPTNQLISNIELQKSTDDSKINAQKHIFKGFYGHEKSKKSKLSHQKVKVKNETSINHIKTLDHNFLESQEMGTSGGHPNTLAELTDQLNSEKQIPKNLLEEKNKKESISKKNLETQNRLFDNKKRIFEGFGKKLTEKIIKKFEIIDNEKSNLKSPLILENSISETKKVKKNILNRLNHSRPSSCSKEVQYHKSKRAFCKQDIKMRTEQSPESKKSILNINNSENSLSKGLMSKNSNPLQSNMRNQKIREQSPKPVVSNKKRNRGRMSAGPNRKFLRASQNLDQSSRISFNKFKKNGRLRSTHQAHTRNKAICLGKSKKKMVSQIGYFNKQSQSPKIRDQTGELCQITDLNTYASRVNEKYKQKMKKMNSRDLSKNVQKVNKSQNKSIEKPRRSRSPSKSLEQSISKSRSRIRRRSSKLKDIKRSRQTPNQARNKSYSTLKTSANKRIRRRLNHSNHVKKNRMKNRSGKINASFAGQVRQSRKTFISVNKSSSHLEQREIKYQKTAKIKPFTLSKRNYSKDIQRKKEILQRKYYACAGIPRKYGSQKPFKRLRQSKQTFQRQQRSRLNEKERVVQRKSVPNRQPSKPKPKQKQKKSKDMISVYQDKQRLGKFVVGSGGQSNSGNPEWANCISARVARPNFWASNRSTNAPAEFPNHKAKVPRPTAETSIMNNPRPHDGAPYNNLTVKSFEMNGVDITKAQSSTLQQTAPEFYKIKPQIIPNKSSNLEQKGNVNLSRRVNRQNFETKRLLNTFFVLKNKQKRVSGNRSQKPKKKSNGRSRDAFRKKLDKNVELKENKQFRNSRKSKFGSGKHPIQQVMSRFRAGSLKAKRGRGYQTKVLSRDKYIRQRLSQMMIVKYK